jgi:hypothetical protein
MDNNRYKELMDNILKELSGIAYGGDNFIQYDAKQKPSDILMYYNQQISSLRKTIQSSLEENIKLDRIDALEEKINDLTEKVNILRKE